MEEKHLLKEITYLSRLIGQHKHNIKPRDGRSCGPQRATDKIQYSLNRSKVNNMVQYPPNKSRVYNVSQYSTNQSKINAHLPVATKHTGTNISKFRKVNIKLEGKSQLPNNPKEGNNMQPVFSGAVQCVLSQPKTVLPTPHSIPIPLSDHKAQQDEIMKPCNLVYKAHSGEKLSGKVPCVHINPQFLGITKLCNVKKSDMVCQSAPMPITQSTSVVHVNPKLLVQLMTSRKQGTIIPSNIHKESMHGNISCVGPASECYVSELNSMSNQSASKTTNESIVQNISTSKGKHSFCSKTKLINESVRTGSSNSGCVPKKNTTVPTMKGKSVSSTHVSKRHLRYSQSGALMSVSRTKLVRVPLRTRRSSFQKIPRGIETKLAVGVATSSTFLPVSASKVIRRSVPKMKDLPSVRTRRVSYTYTQSASVKTARSVCSKYKLRNLPGHTLSSKVRHSPPMNRSVPCSGSKYKIDRRIHKTTKRLKNVKKYSVKYENVKRGVTVRRPGTPKNKGQMISPINRFSCSNKVWSSTGFSQPRKLVISHRKLSRIGNNSNVRTRKIEQNSALVRIGGVLYKTSRTKLTRSKDSSQHKMSSIVRKRKRNSGHIVYVRGNKFLMDPLGKTLKRISNGNSQGTNGQQCGQMRQKTPKRVDIGGVTFVQKSSDILMRTNTHNARNLLSQAKQRSIALLTRKMRKNNQPCIFYRRFGKCSRHEKGTCQMLHDRKHIAICKKFLQGQCDVTGCLMSHDVVPEKMPTCRFFLEGCCVRDNCPYLHVKVSAKAVICHSFLQGYCANGPRCKKRHVYLCPEFDQSGTCRKGKYCPYPHKAGVETKKVVSKSIKRSCKKSANGKASLEPEKKRYYQSGPSNLEATKTSDEVLLAHTEENKDSVGGKRTKLLKEVVLVKRPWKDGDCVPEIPSSSSNGGSPHHEEDSDDEPQPKRPKLGWLPSYIALDSEIHS